MGNLLPRRPAGGSAEDPDGAYEQKLIEMGLGRDQILQQSLAALRVSLEKITDLIAHPDALGRRTYRVSMGVMVASGEMAVEFSALPLLLERKRLILDRIALLAGEAKVNDLRVLAEKAEPDVREALEAKINELDSEVKKWREQAIAAEDAQKEAERQRQIELAKMEIFERRSKVWQSFLERQSVATMLGAILLLLIFIFIAIAAGLGNKIPEIVSNAFLVILGYFFGQSSSSGGSAATK